MTTVVVLDTDFLSAFLKIQRLDLVRDFYEHGRPLRFQSSSSSRNPYSRIQSSETNLVR